MLIDTHAHLNFRVFKEDTDKVIRRSLEGGIWMINVGTNYETSKRAVEIAEKYEKGVYVAIGLHPINLDTGLVRMKIDAQEGSNFERDFDYTQYRELAKSEKVVAIGEIGLDYYWKPKTKKKLELFKEKQKTVLCQQLKLAKELNLPVIFHCRQAHQDLIELLSAQSELRPQKAVAHSFVGNLDQLQKYLDFGFYVGFNGIIFKSIEGINSEENIKRTPLDKILIETDCPYLAPPPFENQRNEPLYVKYVAERIAKIKNLAKRTSFSSSPSPAKASSAYEEITNVTTENAKKLFRI